MAKMKPARTRRSRRAAVKARAFVPPYAALAATLRGRVADGAHPAGSWLGTEVEIAAEAGIYRQGVHDLIKRCNKILSDYEDKLGLVAKFEAARVKVDEIHKLANADGSYNSTVKEIERLSGEILEAF